MQNSRKSWIVFHIFNLYTQYCLPINQVEAQKELVLDIIQNIYSELCNLSLECVAPFTKRDTFIFRKYYGILENEESSEMEEIILDISLSTGLTSTYIHNLIETLEARLAYRVSAILNNAQPCKIKISSCPEILKNKPVSSFFNNQISDSLLLKKLTEYAIYTMEDLLTFTTTDLSKFLGKGKNFERILNIVHGLGLGFIDEFEIDAENTLTSLNAQNDEQTLEFQEIQELLQMKKILTKQLKKITEQITQIDKMVEMVEKKLESQSYKINGKLDKRVLLKDGSKLEES